jgi:uncharacterized protein (TIGR03067 family)
MPEPIPPTELMAKFADVVRDEGGSLSHQDAEAPTGTLTAITSKWLLGGRKVIDTLTCRLVPEAYEVPLRESAAETAWGLPLCDTAAGPDDLAISAGRWDVVSVERDGTPIDPDWLARLQVAYKADGSWAVLLRRLPVAEGTSTIRQDTSPKTFEMETLGSEGIKPSRFKGIYRLDGDTRVLCIVRHDAPRPDDFSAPRNSGRMLVTLKRVKDDAIR